MHNASAAYARTAKTTLAPRELEASLLLKAAAKLQTVKDGWPETLPDLDAALTYNKKLWTVLVTSVTRPENPLPNDLKSNVANLGIFVLGKTLEAELHKDPARLTPVIRINRELAAGLGGR